MNIVEIRDIIRRILNESKEIKADINLPKDVFDINNIFKKNGYKLYVVGGSVRDFLMGKKPKDFDLATDAHPDKTIEILSPYYKLVETGKAFGVVNVIAPSGEYEIAAFRKDIGSGRRPDSVEFTDISTDVKRRDLTINALFYDIDKKVIVDLVGGVEDIKGNIVRTVGDPKIRFDEDKLRKLRAFRFAARMGSKLENDTAKAIMDDNSLGGVSPERIRDEFTKGVASAKSVVSFIKMLEEFKMMPWIFSTLKLTTPVETKNVPILLAVMLRDNSIQDIKNKLQSLRYTSDEISKIIFLVSLIELSSENALQMKKAFKITGLLEKELIEFGKFIRLDMKLISAFNKFEPSVSSKELVDAGFKGKELGQEINRLESINFSNIYNKI